MREKLKALSELQKVDLEIANVRRAAEVYPKQLSELEKDLAAARSAVDAERQRLSDIERQRASLEQNIADEKDKVRKWEARLAEQRSTREYAALAREIDIAKKSNVTMAEELVELGKTLATARETLKQKDADFQTRQSELGGRMTELKAKLAEVGGEVQKLEAQRSGVAGNVDPTLLRRYDAVKKKRLPAFVVLHAPGTCQGCHMNIPPQLYNTLRTSLGYDVCPSCHRIICAAETLTDSSSATSAP